RASISSKRRRNSPAQSCWTCNTQSVAGATFIALLQQRRFAAARDGDAVSDAHRTAVSLIEKCTPRIVTYGKDQLLPFFSFGARLEDHTNGHTGCGNPLGRQHAISVNREFRAKIVVFQHQPHTRPRNTDVRVNGCRRLGTIAGPCSEQTKLLEYIIDGSGACVVGQEKPRHKCKDRTQPHVTARSDTQTTIAASSTAAIDLATCAASIALSS